MSLKSLNRYMCLKLSIAINGKSAVLFPKWCSGCANFRPSAIDWITFFHMQDYCITTVEVMLHKHNKAEADC
ncbi:hypothetical protein ALC56_05642 [Trachymyrmex septentrionalis]|uniref:Uncharacterized protein n=1 Tax=Trachymyrmex septentrionalis TaxID=34720 RepID=A0A195FIR2_9HYME|nr:hypothetical protein ALC56_05642 [Trachymyrmex septentrionalis]